MYVLTKEEGGRHTPFSTATVRSSIARRTLKHHQAARRRGDGHAHDNIRMEIALINFIAMDEGLRFAIREGGRTVGSGVVSSLIAD